MDWRVLDRAPVKIKKLEEGPRALEFCDFEDFDQLVLAAESIDDPNYLLIGSEVGLRRGEMRSLR